MNALSIHSDRARQPGCWLRRSTALLTLLVSAPSLASLGSDALLNLPIPEDAQREIVELDLQQNGARVSIATYHSDESLQASLDFYRSLWPSRDDVPGHFENVLGDWHLISRVDDRISTVVQLKSATHGGTEGLLSTLERDALVTNVPLPVGLPAGSTLLSSTGSDTGIRPANTWVVQSASGVGQLAGHFRDRLERADWTLVSDRRHGSAHVLLFNRRGATLEVVIERDTSGSSVAVINRTRGHDR